MSDRDKLERANPVVSVVAKRKKLQRRWPI